MTTGFPRPLEGKLIRLRARQEADEPLFYEWINDPEVTEHLQARYPFSHAQEREFVERTSTPGYSSAQFSVETLAEARLIGSVGLNCPWPESRTAILGIMIGDKDFWDRGYGTDTMRTVCRFGLEEMNLHRIELEVYAANARARRVYERVGFKVEGVKREQRYAYGRYVDVVHMGILASEFNPG